MPHIASQILYRHPSGEIQPREFPSKPLPESRRSAITVQENKPLNAGTPSLSLLMTNLDQSQMGPNFNPRIRSPSHGTPISGVDSVFDIPSATSYEGTPNSSTYSLAYEMEDTSPCHTKYRTRSKSSPKRAGFSSTVSHSIEKPSRISGNLIEKSSVALRAPRRTSSPHSMTKPHMTACLPLSTPTGKHRRDAKETSQNTLMVMRSQPHLRSASVPIPVQNDVQPPPVPEKISLPRLQASADIKSRCDVALDSIAAVEKENRQLFERALAAETKAKALEELNFTLQDQVARYEQNRRPRSIHSREHCMIDKKTPTSTFRSLPNRRRPPPLDFTSQMKSVSWDHDFAARGSPVHSPHRQIQADTYLPVEISGPLPGPITKQQIMYKGSQISNATQVATISLADARLREKPLPYILPLSPSAVPGFVEMGTKMEICATERLELKKKKTIGDLFRRNKKLA